MSQNKLFSKKDEGKHIIYRIFGVKLSIKNKEYYRKKYLQFQDEIKIQDKYDLTNIKNAKKLILFLIPSPDDTMINGGIMSIFSICEASREINGDVPCVISTCPHSKTTYAHNNMFLNNESIYRFSQIVENAEHLEEMILHIPEYYVKDFYNDLQKNDIKFLKSIKNLHINILNQNIELMPEPKKLKDLYKLTNNITQTIAHDRYATQEICDKWQIPTHLFSVNIDKTRYKSYLFEEKEKIIVISPDWNENKDRIVAKLEKELPDWKLVTVKNMTFTEYMNLISRAFFTITFGEGFDGYFVQPPYVNSVGFAVYNDNFFPGKDWKNLKNVYASNEEMFEKIIEDINFLQNNADFYSILVKEMKIKLYKLYNKNSFKMNLKNFYNKNYDFIPRRGEFL